MLCPKCKIAMVVKLVLTGGCGCARDGECCCPDPDAHVEFQCVNHNQLVIQTTHVKNTIKSCFVKNPDYCSQPNIKVVGLGDQHEISTWLTEHL